METEFHRVIAAAELQPGQRHVAKIGEQQVLLINAGGVVHAVSNICSHANETLDCGRAGKNWIACPVHGARFELATGRAMNPPATRPIKVFVVRVADDWIEVQL